MRGYCPHCKRKSPSSRSCTYKWLHSYHICIVPSTERSTRRRNTADKNTTGCLRYRTDRMMQPGRTNRSLMYYSYHYRNPHGLLVRRQD
jgi:hypothetical protein